MSDVSILPNESDFCASVMQHNCHVMGLGTHVTGFSCPHHSALGPSPRSPRLGRDPSHITLTFVVQHEAARHDMVGSVM